MSWTRSTSPVSRTRSAEMNSSWLRVATVTAAASANVIWASSSTGCAFAIPSGSHGGELFEHNALAQAPRGDPQRAVEHARGLVEQQHPGGQHTDALRVQLVAAGDPPGGGSAPDPPPPGGRRPGQLRAPPPAPRRPPA